MGDSGVMDWLAVMWHGLPLDLSMAGYLTAIPALLLIVSVFVDGKWIAWTLKIYFMFTSTCVSLAFIVNIALYGFWGFPLDSTPLFYFFSSPAEAVASVSLWPILLGVVALLACVFILSYVAGKCINVGMACIYNNMETTIALVLLTALLFIPIRGGITVSTMNTGKAYFSDDQRLNHAAVNPLFSFVESVVNEGNIDSRYRFMGEAEANKLFKAMTCTRSDSTRILLNTRRPDVLIIIMESFSNKVMATLGGEKGVAVNLDRLASEGVLFTNFYANSFRTDRGLVSVLSGYPAQPTMSIMQYPRKTDKLPSIGRSLRGVGYSTKYYYGGDADFTNMRSYLVSSGFNDIVSDVSFPVGERLSKWGVPDGFVFDRLLGDLRKEKGGRGMLRVLQTSSSHEPFDVPYHRLGNKILNAFAYADDCIGRFISEFKKLPQWKNTLVVLVPDHLGAYPPGISNFVLDRYRIPLILTGGAVNGRHTVNVIGSQQDIAATLLGQMGIPHADFTFSKDMLSPLAPHFAFFTVPDAFGMVFDSGSVIYDNKSGKVVLGTGKAKGHNLRYGEAYLQKLYDDMARR